MNTQPIIIRLAGEQPNPGQPNDHPEMKSTPVEHPCSFHSSRLSQPPISAANQNSGSPSCQDHSEFWGLYKTAQTDPSQDLTATHSRVNISGFGLSSPALQQPYTKPFSGLPSRQFMTSPHRLIDLCDFWHVAKCRSHQAIQRIYISVFINRS